MPHDDTRDHSKRSGLGTILGVLAEKRVLTYFNFLVMAAILAFFFTQLRWSLTRQYTPGALMPLAFGSADVPFQLRTLVPWITSWTFQLLESKPPFDSVLKIYHIIEMVSTFLLFVVFRHYLALFIKNFYASAILSFSLLYPLSFNYLFPLYFSIYDGSKILPSVHFYPEFINLYYPYDIPSIMLFTLGLIFIYKSKWRFYYPLFVLATFNRETTLFLTFIYLFTAFRKDDNNTIMLHCVTQLFIWAAIKYFLHLLYSGNPGMSLEKGLMFNLKVLTTPFYYPYILSNMGFIWLPTLLFYRHLKEDFVKRSLLVLIPFASVTLAVAKFTELRGFGEVIPVVLTAFVLILREFLSEGAPAPRQEALGHSKGRQGTKRKRAGGNSACPLSL
jgi:hypothetical protein